MILLRLGFDSRCALMPPPVDPVGQLIPPSPRGPTMRATEWAVNGLAGSSEYPSGLISVKPVWIATVLGSGPGALVGPKRIGSVGHDHGRPCSPARGISPTSSHRRRAHSSPSLRSLHQGVTRALARYFVLQLAESYLTRTPLSADSRAHRTARMASDVIESLTREGSR